MPSGPVVAIPPILPEHEKAPPERLGREVVGRFQRLTAMLSMSNIAGVRAFGKGMDHVVRLALDCRRIPG